MPQGNCTQVERAVDGIRSTSDLHWINAVGLIDADDRDKEQLAKLLERGIAALDCYSVESLYYNLEIVKRISKRVSGLTGQAEKILFEKATSSILEDIKSHKERLCSRLCERHVRNLAMSNLPKHTDIQAKNPFEIKFDLRLIFEEEEGHFDKLVANTDLDGLISRYPIRETQVLTKIADGLGFTREQYEGAVRKLIVDDKKTREFYSNLLQPLSKLIET